MSALSYLLNRIKSCTGCRKPYVRDFLLPLKTLRNWRLRYCMRSFSYCGMAYRAVGAKI